MGLLIGLYAASLCLESSEEVEREGSESGERLRFLFTRGSKLFERRRFFVFLGDTWLLILSLFLSDNFLLQDTRQLGQHTQWEEGNILYNGW